MYSLIAAGRENRLLPKLGKLIEERLADNKCTGDTRATWLFAKAYFQEVGTAQTIRPGRGLSALNEALVAAETTEYRFLSLQEIVARLMTVNHLDEAKSLIAGIRGQFSESEQQTTIDGWLVVGDQVSAKYAEAQNKKNEVLMQEFSKEMSRMLYIFLRTFMIVMEIVFQRIK